MTVNRKPVAILTCGCRGRHYAVELQGPRQEFHCGECREDLQQIDEVPGGEIPQKETGTLWQDRDWREFGSDGEPRVVEVLPRTSSMTIRTVRVKVVEAPNKPHTIGRIRYMSWKNLRRRYRLIRSSISRAA